MRWDIATWRGPVPHAAPQMTGHDGVVIHHAEGTFEGTIAWEKNSSSYVSSHFVVSYDGAIAQMVDTDTQAWCQSAGNARWLSIENEGYSTEELTPSQVIANARIVAYAYRHHDIPLKISNDPGTPGLGYHGMGGKAWGNHTGCPGYKTIGQRAEILRKATIFVLGGDYVMAGMEEIIQKWSQGVAKTGDGQRVCPVEWRIRDESWQKEMGEKVSALAASIASMHVKIDQLTVGGVDVAAVADAVVSTIAARAKAMIDSAG